MKEKGTTAISVCIKQTYWGMTSEFRSEWDASNDPSELGPLPGSMIAQAIMAMNPSRLSLLMAEIVESASEYGAFDAEEGYGWSGVEKEFVSAAYKLIKYWNDFDNRSRTSEETE